MPFIDPDKVIIRERFRKELEIEEMVKLIEAMGFQTNPIIVEHGDNGQYLLLDGERRTRACQKMGRQVWYTTDKDGAIDIEDELTRRRIELMSNTGKHFTPVEKACLIEEIDRLMKDKFGQRKAGKPSPYLKDTDKQGWSYSETATLLGLKSPSSVQDAIMVAKAATLMPEIKEAKTVAEAKRIVTRRAQEEARAELMRRGEELIKVRDSSFDPRKFYEEKIILGDCLKGMGKLPNGIVDYFVTDPPFGLEMDNIPSKNPELSKRALGTYEDSEESIFKLLEGVITQMARVGKPNCWAYMMCSSGGFYRLKQMFEASGFQVYQKPLIWEKVDATGKIIAGICQAMEFWPASCYETILLARRGVNQLYLQGQPDILRHQIVPPSEKCHFVERPISLLEDLIGRLHHPGTTAILCDPFVGGGSTLVAAYHIQGIQAFGYELNPEFRNRAIDHLIRDYLSTQGVSAMEAYL